MLKIHPKTAPPFKPSGVVDRQHEIEIVPECKGTSATAGAIARNHYYGGFTIGATVSTAAKYQTFSDHLGNVREVVASSGTSPAIGTVVTRYDYSPYQGPSKVYQHPGTNVEATFQSIGRYYHHTPSGLELALYRAYDPELGRWISEDPIGERGGLNLYCYGMNQPVTRIDYLGLSCCDQNRVEEVIRSYSAMASRRTAQVTQAIFRREFGGAVCCNKVTGAVAGELPMREGTPGIWRPGPG